MTAKKARTRGPEQAGPKGISFADSVLRLPTPNGADGLQLWLYELESWHNAYLRVDPLRPGAAELHRAKQHMRSLKKAMLQGDATVSVIEAIAVMKASFAALALDSEGAIRGGVRSIVGANSNAIESSQQADVRHAEWQRRADKKRAEPGNAEKSKKWLASKIALPGENPNTIRRSIK